LLSSPLVIASPSFDHRQCSAARTNVRRGACGVIVLFLHPGNFVVIRLHFFALAFALILAGCSSPESTPTMTDTPTPVAAEADQANPLLTVSALLFQAPPF